MSILSDQNQSQNLKRTLKLAPLPLWKWLAAIFLLLSVPVAILIRQAIGAFHATAIVARNEVSQEVEKLASRFSFEAKTSTQVKELLRDYSTFYVEPMKGAAVLRQLRTESMIGIHPILESALHLSELALMQLQRNYEKRLRRLIPGLKLIKWGLNLETLPDSDQLTPRWAYQKLTESIIKSINPGGNERGAAFDYLESVPMLNRYFTEAPGLGSFLKYGGELLECINPTGAKLLMFWESERAHWIDFRRRIAGGFLAVVEVDRLSRSFGMQTLMLRKSHEWQHSGVSVGWVVESEPEKRFLPYPFPAADEDAWVKWLVAQPDGIYERSGILLSLRRSTDGLLLLTAASTVKIQLHYERKVFLLGLLLLFSLLIPLFLILGKRRNDGMAVSIRLQITGLFVFAMLLPAAAIFQLGSELMQDRQKSFENDAYKEIERIKKDLDENQGYAFRQLEKMSNDMCQQLMQLKFDAGGKFAEPEQAVQVLHKYRERVNVLHVYLFNSYAETVFSNFEGEDKSEGSSLLPLVQSLAKIKLRSAGRLKTKGKILDVSLMDLVVESTGGSNLDEIKAILNARENRAFEMKFSGRRSIFFIGQFTTDQLPGETFSLVMLMRDSHFERLYLRMMIEKICAMPGNRNRIQLFFGDNDCGASNYFWDAPLQNPWFAYTYDNPDSLKIGRLSEPTRFTGNSVKEKVELNASSRKYLMYSFKPSSVEQHSVVALFDFEEIARELRRLQQFILVSFVVSLIIVLVLARIMARSLIEPVVLLKRGVEQVESGNFQTEVVLPGQDEMVELAQAFNKMNQGLDERERMTRYLSRSAVDAVVSGEDRQMGGKKVPATILFSDIRSFTTISESNSPEDVVSLLNEYFAAMNEVVERFGGDIDKFIGDAIMAQFITGAGNDPAILALNAVKCALGMMSALSAFNKQRAERGLFPLKIGVGINSGDVIAGNIGSPGRMDRTVIGDTVNVASRLEGMSKLGKHTCVIISRATLELVKSQIEVVQLSETAVKGKTSAVEMFEVIRLKEYN